MTLTFRMSEAPDSNPEKTTKNACEKIVELSQQITNMRCALAQDPNLVCNTSRIAVYASLYAPGGPLLPPSNANISPTLDGLRTNISSLSKFIRTIPAADDEKIPPAEVTHLDFDQDKNHPRQMPQIVSRDAGFSASPLDSFVYQALDAILTSTADGVIQTLNQKAEQLFAYKSQELHGFPIETLVEHISGYNHPPDGPGQSEPFRWQPVASDAPLRGRKKNGELFPIEVLESRYTQNGINYRLYCIKDLATSSRLDQRIAELECEIAYLSRHSVLGELATTITHELSQPLTAITNYTAAAMRCLTQPLPEQRDSGLDLIVKAGDQAKRAWLIMHRLRKLMQHRGIECVRDDLRVAIEEAVQLATLGADRHGIQVTVELPPEPVMVSMDRVHIQVLVTNLIRNAIDELSVSAGEKAMWIRLKVLPGNLAELSVEDTGTGIAPDIYENIFDPFHTTKPQGLGVGLAVSRRIAQAHGGRLSAENGLEGGAVFRFVVPMSMSEKVKNE